MGSNGKIRGRIRDLLAFFNQFPGVSSDDTVRLLKKVHLVSYMTQEEFMLAWAIAYTHRIYSEVDWQHWECFTDELKYGMHELYCKGYEFISYDFDDDGKLTLCSTEKIGPGPGIITRMITSYSWPETALRGAIVYAKKRNGEIDLRADIAMMEEALAELEGGTTPADQIARSEAAEWN